MTLIIPLCFDWNREDQYNDAFVMILEDLVPNELKPALVREGGG